MDDKVRLELLEKSAEELLREKKAILEQLNRLQGLGSIGQTSMDYKSVVGKVMETCGRVIPLSASCIYLLDEGAADFLPALFEPRDAAPAMAREVEKLIWDGTFAWALGQDRPHMARSENASPMVLHVMSSGGHIRGMFIGILSVRERDVSDAALPLLSLVLRLGASMLGGCSEGCRELERRVRERTRELSLAKHKLMAEVQERARVEDHFRTIFDNAVEGIFRFQATQGFSMANPAMARLLGYDSPEKLLKGVNTIREQVFLNPEDHDTLLDRLALRDSVSGFEAQVLARDGRLLWLSFSARTVSRQDGRVLEVEGLASDVTDRKGREERLTRQANIDEVTGIPNRAQFNSTLRRMMQQARRSGQGMALLFIDLDHFKQINDTYGHQLGDDVLKQVAGRISSRVRGADLASRLGGDEFCVILHDVNSRSTCPHVASDLIRAIGRDLVVQGELFRVGASIGIYLYQGGNERPEDLVRKADKAMYHAKNQGRNACHVFGDTVVRTL